MLRGGTSDRGQVTNGCRDACKDGKQTCSRNATAGWSTLVFVFHHFASSDALHSVCTRRCHGCFPCWRRNGPTQSTGGGEIPRCCCRCGCSPAVPPCLHSGSACPCRSLLSSVRCPLPSASLPGAERQELRRDERLRGVIGVRTVMVNARPSSGTGAGERRRTVKRRGGERVEVAAHSPRSLSPAAALAPPPTLTAPPPSALLPLVLCSLVQFILQLLPPHLHTPLLTSALSPLLSSARR